VCVCVCIYIYIYIYIYISTYDSAFFQHIILVFLCFNFMINRNIFYIFFDIYREPCRHSTSILADIWIDICIHPYPRGSCGLQTPVPRVKVASLVSRLTSIFSTPFSPKRHCFTRTFCGVLLPVPGAKASDSTGLRDTITPARGY